MGASEIERVHGEWLVVVRCDANDVCLERVPLKSSIYMWNGWFSSSLMMPMMCVLSGLLLHV